MGCVQNPKQFWKFKWNGPHKKEIDSITRFGSFAWHEYLVNFCCERCGVSLGQRHATEEQLVNIGFDVEKLHGLGQFASAAEHLKVGAPERRPPTMPAALRKRPIIKEQE